MRGGHEATPRRLDPLIPLPPRACPAGLPAGGAPTTDDTGARMDDQLIEELSDAVHQGWMAEKQRQGFADHVLRPQGRWGMVYRPLPCCLLPEEKHHPDM